MKLGILRRSLSFRLQVALSVAVAAVLAVHALLSFHSLKSDFLRMTRAQVERSSGLIRRATHDGMLLNRLDDVQTTIKRLGNAPDVAAIRVYGKDGTIVLSVHENEIGQQPSLESDTCRSCHPKGGSPRSGIREQSSLVRGAQGNEVLRQLSIIENEADCASTDCHATPAETPVLGVLDVEMSMAPLDASIRQAQRQLIWTTGSLVLIIGIVASVFIRRLVRRPVLKLYEGTRRIASGDLRTHIDVEGQHELAALGSSFNRMVEDLASARREITDWSQTLEAKVVEKTEELRRAQRQVLHMEKMASLGKLAATVAHEINNPISGMLTYAKLAEREVKKQPIDDDTKREVGSYLSLLQKECSRCGEIVKNLLLFARRTGTEMSSVDINEIVERSAMLVRHHLEMRGIRLDRKPLPDDSRIVADSGQLQQALVALLVNAVEAMAGVGEGEGHLTIRLEGDEDQVGIEVSDNGIGIPAEALPRIFEPFFSTKDSESGVGLGLAVVYGIVQRHGGQIDVDSIVGRGTTFRLRLPRRPDLADGAVPTATHRRAG